MTAHKIKEKLKKTTLLPLRAGQKQKKRISPSASITLEATILLPLFLILFAGILSMFEFLRVQNAMEMALHQSGNRLAITRFEVDTVAGVGEDLLLRFDENGKFQEAINEIPDGVVGAGRQAIDALIGHEWAMDYLRINPILETPVLSGDILIGPVDLSNNGIIALEALWDVHPYLNIFGLSDISMTARYYGHDWTGFHMDTEEEDESEEEDDPTVYMAKLDGQHVYHRDPVCRYLKINSKACSDTEIKDRRNQSGAKYYPCETCGGGSGTVYYTKYGRRYHSGKDCPQIERDCIPIKESEAIALGSRPCSECGGK